MRFCLAEYAQLLVPVLLPACIDMQRLASLLWLAFVAGRHCHLDSRVCGAFDQVHEVRCRVAELEEAKGELAKVRRLAGEGEIDASSSLLKLQQPTRLPRLLHASTMGPAPGARQKGAGAVRLLHVGRGRGTVQIVVPAVPDAGPLRAVREVEDWHDRGDGGGYVRIGKLRSCRRADGRRLLALGGGRVGRHRPRLRLLLLHFSSL
jgi:hypothetical protein